MENSDALINESVLSQAKDVLNRLIIAVDILLDNGPTAIESSIEDIISQIDDVLESKGSSFSDVHLNSCHCDSIDTLRDQGMMLQLDDEDISSEFDDPNFGYQMIEPVENNDASENQIRNVTFDDMVRGLLALPSSPEMEQRINNPLIDENEDDPLNVDEPVISDDGDGDEEMEFVEDIDFMERMMLYFRETDLILEEEQQGSGDHMLEPGLD
ncbi:uncharacterized protein TNIN_351861 [Trichonephila inaurata madagascariensis]|uniref:Uncharacterized protein n=1 Tax=Trichonephila inaurata madagascariensis TaxID=2747483 RepID=A0A8X6XC58_9ARAC|nr:uncharacterized protein TNIN_351861 [Trichonephila inaurata madagascariensis]